MTKKAYNYINWYKEAQMCPCGPQEWNELIQSLDPDLQIESAAGQKTVKYYYLCGNWAYDKYRNQLFRYNAKDDQFEIWFSNGQEVPTMSGFAARRIFTEHMEDGKWQKRYGAFKQDACDDQWKVMKNYEMIQKIHDINRSVGPLIGNDIMGNLTIEKNLWKADVKSAYPFNSLDNLPDLHKSEVIYGAVEPSEEWPIVYYLDSHNIAEYQVFDTRFDQFHYLYQNFRSKKANKHTTKGGIHKNEDPMYCLPAFGEEWCLRCKYAPRGLRNEMIYFYNEKEAGDEMAKQVINLVIGTCDTVSLDNNGKYVARYSKYKYFGHIRALILGRHNHRMCQYYNEIKRKGYKFLCIQTDSIMWVGDGPIDSAVHSREIGSLNLEIENGKGYIHACGVYVVYDDNNLIVKSQGMKNFDKSKVNDIESFKQELKDKSLISWNFNKDTLLWDIKEAKLEV